MIEEFIKKVSNKINLETAEIEQAVSFIAEGRVSEKEIADFLSALSRKKETAAEITGAALALRRYVKRVNIDRDIVLDTCGTGGDQKHTFNISTVSAFVVAGAGITVAKHGNRSVSSLCGSGDILEAFGVNIHASVEVVEKCLNEIGIGFLFAPILHPAFAYVQPVRKVLKMRTIFNVMGPLINPAYPTHQLIGVFNEELVPVIAQVLKNLELKHAMVACGEGGLDEVTTTGRTFISEMSSGHIKDYVLEPEKLGLARATFDSIRGGDIDANKQIASGVLKGMEGPYRDIVLLNAGCSVYITGRANTIKEGMQIAAESIDSGSAIKKLNKLIEYTNT